MVRFDTPCFAVRGAVEYFRAHMALGDYLTEAGQAEVTWFGTGARRLGLTGQCDLAQFTRLCRGWHPISGEQLTVRDQGARRRVGYFGQISPPKDVSVLHLVGGDQRIAAWWHEAVNETLTQIEAVAATRVRRGGRNTDRTTGNLIAAVVTHDTNRSLDPQLHTHLCLMNLTWDPAEARWKGLQPSGFYRHQGYFREVCYNGLARRMREAGYVIDPVRKAGFTIHGLPPELRDRFSNRRQVILAAATATGATSQDALQQVALRTREKKTHATAATLRARWLAACAEFQKVLGAVIASADGTVRQPFHQSAIDLLRSAEAHLFERRSVVPDRLLLREALAANRGGVALSDLTGALAAREQSGELLRVGEDIASRAALAAEQEFTGWAAAGCARHGPLGKMLRTLGLAPDQAQAVAGLMASRSTVTILQGDAGTGKTMSLQAVVRGIEQAGGRVFGCAPSAGAAQVLRQELTPEADTLQQLLVNEALQRQVRGRTLLVDEAGLVSVREMRDLCRLAARNQNRLLLVGDVKQHHAVEAGDALRALHHYGRVPRFSLTEIRRQRDPAYRQAVALLARGDAFGAFDQFQRLGAVQERRGEGLWAAAATDYVRTVRAGKTCLAISPVWKEIHLFTTAAREQLKHAAVLAREERLCPTFHSLKWTREERRRPEHYQAGDVITFHRACGPHQKYAALTVLRVEGRGLLVRDPAGREHRLNPTHSTAFDVGLLRDLPVAPGERLLMRGNLAAARLQNGDLVIVTGFGEDGSIQLRDGRSLPPGFREFSHGYATTSHAAQGKTVDRGLLLMAADGIAAGNLKQAYVANSRFRESQMIYTSDRLAAREAMQRPADRLLAMELLDPVRESSAGSSPTFRFRAAIEPKPEIRTAA